MTQDITTYFLAHPEAIDLEGILKKAFPFYGNHIDWNLPCLNSQEHRHKPWPGCHPKSRKHNVKKFGNMHAGLNDGSPDSGAQAQAAAPEEDAPKAQAPEEDAPTPANSDPDLAWLDPSWDDAPAVPEPTPQPEPEEEEEGEPEEEKGVSPVDKMILDQLTGMLEAYQNLTTQQKESLQMVLDQANNQIDATGEIEEDTKTLAEILVENIKSYGDKPDEEDVPESISDEEQLKQDVTDALENWDHMKGEDIINLISQIAEHSETGQKFYEEIETAWNEYGGLTFEMDEKAKKFLEDWGADDPTSLTPLEEEIIEALNEWDDQFDSTIHNLLSQVVDGWADPEGKDLLLVANNEMAVFGKINSDTKEDIQNYLEQKDLIGDPVTETPEPMPGSVAGTLSMENLTKVGAQKGNTPGGTYNDSVTGKDFYVKEQKSPDHAGNEILANSLYKMLGIDAPMTTAVEGTTATTAAAMLPTGYMTIKDLGGPSVLSPDQRKKINAGFVIDAWMANWDVVGTGYDNIMVNPVTGGISRIDSGGSLLYRAQGGAKGAAFSTDEVSEFETFFSGKNEYAKTLFEGLDEDDVNYGLGTLGSITKTELYNRISNTPFMSQDSKDKVFDTLWERRNLILEKGAKGIMDAKHKYVKPPEKTYSKHALNTMQFNGALDASPGMHYHSGQLHSVTNPHSYADQKAEHEETFKDIDVDTYVKSMYQKMVGSHASLGDKPGFHSHAGIKQSHPETQHHQSANVAASTAHKLIHGQFKPFGTDYQTTPSPASSVTAGANPAKTPASLANTKPYYNPQLATTTADPWATMSIHPNKKWKELSEKAQNFKFPETTSGEAIYEAATKLATELGVQDEFQKLMQSKGMWEGSGGASAGQVALRSALHVMDNISEIMEHQEESYFIKTRKMEQTTFEGGWQVGQDNALGVIPMIAATRAYMQNRFKGQETVDVYRGLRGDVADDIKAEMDSGKAKIRIPHDSYSGYSFNLGTANGSFSSNGVILAKKIPLESVYIAFRALKPGYEGEDEIIVDSRAVSVFPASEITKKYGDSK